MTVFHSALAVVSIFGLACHDAPDREPIDCAGRPVLMGVASSLREVARPLREELLARDEPIDVEMIFGASSTHARQLTLGAPMDVLVSADAEIVEDLVERGLLTPSSTLEFARGRLVLTARADWNSEYPGVGALDSSNLKRIALPSAAVPLGRYARHWLANRTQTEESEEIEKIEALEGRIVTTEHARATLSAVDEGHVDLAIVYESDARLARHAVVLARIDPSEYPPIRYVAARVAAAPSCPSIDEVVAAWTNPNMKNRLASAGFLPAGATEAL